MARLPLKSPVAKCLSSIEEAANEEHLNDASFSYYNNI